MKIVADENIPFLHECFGQVGEVVALNGRHLTRSDVADADALIVRSVTRVNRDLLAESPVRFVGSCTIGIDHIDTDYLDERGILFASAPGSNADSAAQYTLCALLTLSERFALDWSQLTLGVIGFGNVGSRVVQLAEALGCKTLACDPPLAERGKEGLASCEQVASEADVLSFHVPLTRNGRHPTWRMINRDLLERMHERGILINCARGDIIDSEALIEDIGHRGRRAVIDVWPNEPRVDERLLSMVQIATPHIAGYSLDGKLRGTEMVYGAFCRALNIDAPAPAIDLEEPEVIHIPEGASIVEAVLLACRQSYDIVADDEALRELLVQPKAEQGAFFDRLRKHYPVRREFAAYHCQGGSPEARAVLERLGFHCR
ncbi:MAG: 4-phosphoerythronate dehydrogenase [Pseudomonadota bacterium]